MQQSLQNQNLKSILQMTYNLLRFFCVVGILVLHSCTKADKKVLRIAAASNLQYVLPKIMEAYTANTGIACQIIYGSSGKLTAQIEKGALYHVFLSADMKYPTYLYKKKLAISKPKKYAVGNLVLWTMDSSLNLNDIKSQSIQHIAIANPKIAPYGVAAKQYLDKKQWFKSLEKKLVYGENIAQVNQFVISGAAAVGFTSKSAVLALKSQYPIHWKEVSSDAYVSIEQGVVVLNHFKEKDSLATSFVQFLLSNKSQDIFTQNGYN